MRWGLFIGGACMFAAIVLVIFEYYSLATQPFFMGLGAWLWSRKYESDKKQSRI